MINNRFLRLLWASSPLLVAVGLYGYAVYLPFFLDDGLLFAIIMRPPNSPLSWEIWGGSMTFAYYRPFVFSIWEINQSLMGGGKFDPITLHWLNLMVYGMTGVLLGLFIRRFGRLIDLPHRTIIGGLAGLMYVVFPFNYNAVIWVASMFHIFAGFGTMLALWCVVGYLAPPPTPSPLHGEGANAPPFSTTWGKDGGGIGAVWLIGAWLGTFIATFSHENGVLIAPLVGLLLLWVLIGRMNRAAFIRMTIIYIPMLIIIAVYWMLLNTVPRGASPLTILWDDIFDSSALFIQPQIYPVIGAYRKVTLADESISTLWLMGGLTIIPTGLFIVWQSRQLAKFALYGLIWFAIASVPTILFLSTDYVRGSWRLMLFAGIGAGIYWS
nr:hypothetical protein [Anaerolineae bacterium]